MSEFDTRPRGTVMHGAFRHFARAERALRVLKNAGYLRSHIESAGDTSGEGAAILTVDAAATGAARAAEILLEFGAEVRYAGGGQAPTPHADVPPAAEPEIRLATAAPPMLPGAPSAAAPAAGQLPPDFKPRNRKEARAARRFPPTAEVIIKTRGSEVMPLGESFASQEPHGEGTS